MRNYQYFFISINEKQSLKGVIQNAEYEIGVFQNFSTLQHSCSVPLLKVLEKYFWRSLLLCKVVSPYTDRVSQCRCKIYVKLHRSRILVETTLCVHVVNSDL